MDMEKLAQKLKKAIEKKEISNYKLSQQSGIPAQTIGNIVNGVTEFPKPRTLRALAIALDIPLSEIIPDDMTEPAMSYEVVGALNDFPDSPGLSANGRRLVTLIVEGELDNSLNANHIRLLVELAETLKIK